MKYERADLSALFSGALLTHSYLNNLIGADMTRRASKEVPEQAGIGFEEVDVVEFRDCSTTNEVMAY